MTSELELSQSDLRQLESMYMSRFHRNASVKPAAETWFEIVTDFLHIKGAQIVTKSVRDSEDQLEERGQQHEYVAALFDVLGIAEEAVDSSAVIRVTQATPEQRMAAIERVTK